ncbi:MAG: hypothetical protein JSS26_20365 [Nitrospira sp.]|nr:hypothetical protein [Nitrospira sp.]
MDCLRSIDYTISLSDCAKRELSSWLAQDYSPPKYKTVGSAKAAASIHARVAWGLSRGLGNANAPSVHDYIASLGQPTERDASYPNQEELAQAIEEVINSLIPLETDLLSQYFGLGRFARLGANALHRPSIPALADVVGLSTSRVEEALAKALRKIRHPARYHRLADHMRRVVLYKPTLPEEEFFHAVGLQSDDA